ncbi:MAG: alpha/beta fold hydrolase [Rhodospirillaceae bacterium]
MPRPQNLVLIPGLLCDAALWRHQVDHLGDMVTVAVADVTRDDSIRGMAERLLAEAPTTFALAGLSLGGYIAQEIMRIAPERVERLALVATNARADTEEQTKNRMALINLAEVGKFKGVTPRLLPSFVHPDRVDDPSVAPVVMEMAERVGQEAFVRQQRAIMGRDDGRADLEAIRIPTLVLAGRQDILCPPKVQEEMAARLSNGRLVFIEDCGHLPPLERPRATTAVLRYWLG